MTETAVKENTEATGQEENKPAVPQDKLPPLAQALLVAADPVYKELTGVVTKINAVGDVGKLMSEAIEQSQDKQVVALRNKIEAANKAVLEATKAAEALVKPTLDIPSEKELTELDTKQKDLSGALNSFANAFDTEIKRNKVEGDVTLFTYTGDIPGRKRGAKAGQGEGTSRPRVKSVEFTHDKTGKEGWQKLGDEKSSTFSHLLQQIKKDTGESLSANDVHEEWLASQHVKDWKDAPEVSTFPYHVKGKDKEQDYFIRVTR